jgi:hypothetical protein
LIELSLKRPEELWRQTLRAHIQRLPWAAAVGMPRRRMLWGAAQ